MTSADREHAACLSIFRKDFRKIHTVDDGAPLERMSDSFPARFTSQKGQKRGRIERHAPALHHCEPRRVFERDP